MLWRGGFFVSRIKLRKLLRRAFRPWDSKARRLADTINIIANGRLQWQCRTFHNDAKTNFLFDAEFLRDSREGVLQIVSTRDGRPQPCPRRLHVYVGINVLDATLVGRFSGDTQWPVLGDR